jgi:hypothetical protein
MCLRLVLGYGEEDLERARQGVVNALRRGLLRWVMEPVSEAEGLVREVVAGVSAGEPEEWAEGVGQGLRGLVERLVVRLGAQAMRIEALEREREGLRRQLAAYEAEAPVERLRAVTEERDGGGGRRCGWGSGCGRWRGCWRGRRRGIGRRWAVCGRRWRR